MAQFRATIKGQRGQASRLGGKASGMVATVNGWHKGVRVEAIHENGEDFFRVYATTGSSNTGDWRELATI